MAPESSVLPDPATEFGARVARRLADEAVGWLTLVDGSGTPWGFAGTFSVPLRFRPTRVRGH